jgi:hypothetical protein
MKNRRGGSLRCNPGVFSVVSLAAPALTALALTAAAAYAAATLPAALQPPPGATGLSFKLAGDGVQRYQCKAKAGADGAFEWSLVEPRARLLDEARQEVGTHSAGPTWTARDGSKVVRKRLVASVDSPSQGAIPWLLLEVDPSGGGMLGNVRYVQRLDTAGGKAPASGCDAGHAGATSDVPYTATYVFFTGKP